MSDAGETIAAAAEPAPVARPMYVLVPDSLRTSLATVGDVAPEIVSAYQSLWHPHLLANAGALPEWLGTGSEWPAKLEDLQIVVTSAAAKELDDETLVRWKALKNVHFVEPADSGNAGLTRLADHRGLPSVPETCREQEREPLRNQVSDFHALAWADLGIKELLRQLDYDNPVDREQLKVEVLAAAHAWQAGQAAEVRNRLQAAFNLLLTARQTVYPQRIHVVEIVLVPPRISEADFARPDQGTAAFNLLLPGGRLESIALGEQGQTLVEKLRNLNSSGDVTILGGTTTDRPHALLPLTSRFWEHEQAASLYERHLGRQVDNYAATGATLTPDLPHVLTKFDYMYALHASYSQGSHPNFRDPKIRWSAPHKAIIDTLVRNPRDASAESECLSIFATLAKALNNDRSPTVVLVHWLGKHASWFQWWLRSHQYAEVFGHFQPFADFFLNAHMSYDPVVTRIDEYRSHALTKMAERQEADPISRWVRHHKLRGAFDAAHALTALAQVVSGDTVVTPHELEAEVEKAETTEATDGVTAKIDAYRDQAVQVLAASLRPAADSAATNAGAAGYLVFNPCSFPRRVCLPNVEMSVGDTLPAGVRAVQQVGIGRLAVVADVPGWGYAYLPKAPGDTAKPASRPSSGLSQSAEKVVGSSSKKGFWFWSKPKYTPIARGRRLENEHMIVEVDRRHGGLRGVWEHSTGHNRLGAQLVWGPGSQTVAKKLTVTADGPAFGEIRTVGEIRDKRGTKVLAQFTQTARLWARRPILELTIDLEPAIEVTGDPTENYFGIRWAWPDDKADIYPACGLTFQRSEASEWEAPLLVEIRERNLLTDLLPGGLPFHRRHDYRMSDTRLLVAGETARRFRMDIALDLAHPWNAVYDALWPVAVLPVEQGPPARGSSGWFAKIDCPTVLATQLIPYDDYGPGVKFRLAETSGNDQHFSLRFPKQPHSARLTNFRGHLVYELHPSDDSVTIDCEAHAWQQVEVML